jgi:hypothetical protein
MVGRIRYRTRQFWHYLAAAPAANDLDFIKTLLQAPLYDLFKSLSQEEQAHSINVLNKLLERGQKNPDLLTVALLHDVGKSRFPLRLWERVFIVFVKLVLPERSKSWGNSDLLTATTHGWGRFNWLLKKPFLVAEQHPQWGAEMVSKAGGSPLVVALVARHQEKLTKEPSGEEDTLLSKLQMVDDES